jgi:hypothetical protein
MKEDNMTGEWGETRNGYSILVIKPEGKMPLTRPRYT